MDEVKNFILLELEINDRKITKIRDLKTQKILKTFIKPVTEKRYKLYVIKNLEEILYIGITRQSLSTRFRLGLASDGNNGYYGYKWKNHKIVQVYVWLFENYTENQLENIEAELVYLVRNQKGKWPLFQNEIHFNNNFSNGKIIASQIFEILN